MNIQISLADGTTITANIENYNAVELAEQINNQKLTVIAVGDIIFNKNTNMYVTVLGNATQKYVPTFTEEEKETLLRLLKKLNKNFTK